MAKKPVRRHLPSLTPDRLILVQQALSKARNISQAGQRAVMQSLKAAANPAAESPEVVIATLPKERRESVVAHVQQFIQFSQGITLRGQQQLTVLSDEEWSRLVGGQDDTEGI